MICPHCKENSLHDKTAYYSSPSHAVPIIGCLCGYLGFKEFTPVMRKIPDAGNWSSPEARARNKAAAVNNGKKRGGYNKGADATKELP